ncbi:hypothetical protein [Baekduia sp.]|jgi:hypothetical protein|uniref:hypothetical protein n=1 Tax=Baekduia sp. TaxID=2600305 RepID=UPI002DFDE363|nr:hypothetical protein [Baekduia sp.]
MKTARLLAVVALVLAGCGNGRQPAARAAAATSAPRPVASAPCPTNVTHTLGAIARRIYGQAAHGRNVVSARRRLARSRRLAAAVAAGDRARTHAALTPLLKHQIRAITITRGRHVLATISGPPTLAPLRGVLRDTHGRPVGRYVLAVAQDGAIARITRSLIGGRVEIRNARGRLVANSGAGAHGSHQMVASSGAGGRRPRPTVAMSGVDGNGGAVHAASSASSLSFPARAYPTGALTITLRLPATSLATCGDTPTATVAATIGAVGQRLARTEAQGPTVQRVLRHVATDAHFAQAVATDDPVALRTAIIRFFRTRSLHVVRVRATAADGQLVGDVGGPYVLGPASRTVRDARGHPIGTVTLSVQDDTGYIKLMHRFTGAVVVLRTPAGTVPGSTLMPGPSTIPPRGRVTWNGRTYATYAFAAGAFPSGPLTVALLL